MNILLTIFGICQIIMIYINIMQFLLNQIPFNAKILDIDNMQIFIISLIVIREDKNGSRNWRETQKIKNITKNDA